MSKYQVVKQDDVSFPSFCAKYISVSAVSDEIERSMLGKIFLYFFILFQSNTVIGSFLFPSDVVGLVSDDTLTTNKYGDEFNQLTIIDEMGGKVHTYFQVT